MLKLTIKKRRKRTITRRKNTKIKSMRCLSIIMRTTLSVNRT